MLLMGMARMTEEAVYVALVLVVSVNVLLLGMQDVTVVENFMDG